MAAADPIATGNGNLTATTQPLPEIDDNVPVSPQASSNETLSLDEFTSDLPSVLNKQAPTKIEGEVKPIRTDAKQPQSTDEEKENTDEQETEETVETETKDKGAKEDDKSGKDKSSDVKEEPDEKELTPEEVKLHGNTKRDYTGFSDKQVKILKRLDPSRFQAVSEEWRALNQAVGKTVEIAKQLEEQKKIAEGKQIPSSWYEHPEAYQLSPEFRQVSQQYSQYADLENFWQQQLSNVHDGKEWQYVTGYDKQTGQPQYSAPQAATPQAIAWLTQQLTRTTTIKGQLEGHVANMQQSFKQTYQQAAQAIKQEMEDYVSKLDPNIKPLPQDEELIKNVMPAIYRDHPLAYGYQKLGAILFAQGRYLQKLLGAEKQKEKLEADKKLAGARGGNKIPKADPSSSRASSAKVFNLKDIIGDDV